MWPDVEVPQSGSVGQSEAERWFESAPSPSRFEDVGDGAGAGGVTLEGVGNGGGEFLRPVIVEESEQPGGVGSERFSALGESLEEGGGGGDGGAEAVAGGVGVGLAGGGEEPFEMVGVLDGLCGVVAAAVAGELGLLIEDADAGVAGEQRQGLSDVGVGDGVEIAVEADIGGLSGADGADEFGLEGMGGEREESGLLFGPGVGDGAVRHLGVAPMVGDLVAPAPELVVEVVEVSEGSGGEEGMPQVLDLSFDLSFLVAASRRAGAGGEVVVAGEFEQSGVELDGGAAAVEDGGSEVVVDEGAGDAAEGLEGLDMSAEEALEGLVEGEEGGDGAGVAEDHDESGDGAGAASDADLAEGAPVDLCGLAGQGDDAAVDGAGGLGAQASDEASDLDDGAGIAALPDPLVDTGGAQGGVLGRGVADERQIRVEGAGPARAPADASRPALDGGADGLTVEAELGRDGRVR